MRYDPRRFLTDRVPMAAAGANIGATR
jgi:hypothetical protein